MYIRATRVQFPPEAVDKGIAFFKEKIVPMASSAPGNLGQVLLVDRAAGKGIGITQWETAQAMGAAEQVGINARTQSATETGGSIVNVERMEQVFNERVGQPRAGGWVRLWHVFVFAAVAGVITAIETPVRQSFISELVGRDLLP